MPTDFSAVIECAIVLRWEVSVVAQSGGKSQVGVPLGGSLSGARNEGKLTDETRLRLAGGTVWLASRVLPRVQVLPAQ